MHSRKHRRTAPRSVSSAWLSSAQSWVRNLLERFRWLQVPSACEIMMACEAPSEFLTIERARTRFAPLGLGHVRTGVPKRNAVLDRFETLISWRRVHIGRTRGVF